MQRVRGFQIVELLVVLAIIALLLALMFPALASVQQSNNRTVCAYNLSNIFKAAKMREQALAPSPDRFVDANRWVALLRPYIDDEQMLICPEDEFVVGSGGGPAGFLVINGGGTSLKVPLETGTYQKMLSQTQYTDKYLALMKEGDQHPYFFGGGYQGYEPDGQSIYYFVFEDIHDDSHPWFDGDFNDVILKFVKVEGGQWMVEAQPAQAGYTHDYYDNTGKLIIEDCKSHPNEQFDFEGLRTSYGINRDIDILQGDASKVFAADYHRDVIDLGPSGNDDWQAWQEPTTAFGRHEGKMQIVMADGSIDLVHPNELDPDVNDFEIFYKKWGLPPE